MYFYIFIYLLIKCQSIEPLLDNLVLKVHGNSDYLNFYYIILFLGQQKQNQTFILDTTSSITTSPCTLCISCGDHLNDYYLVNSNNSFIDENSPENEFLPDICTDSLKIKKNNHEKNYSYFLSRIDNNQIFGIYLNNIINFETINSTLNIQNNITNNSSNESGYLLPLGCSLKETGYFMSFLADGIIGLNNNNKSFISMIYRKGLISSNLFTLCLDRYDGYISLGIVDTKYHNCSKIKYIDYNPLNELYEIKIEKISIEDYEIPIKFSSILNSASTISYFPEIIFKEIVTGIFLKCAELDGNCGKISLIEGYGICTNFENYSDIDINNSINNHVLPMIKIKFKNYEFNWEPKNYLMNFSSKNKKRICFGIDTEKNLTNIILGTNFMHGYDIIFDRTNYKIGFCKAFCSRNIKENNDINKGEKDISESKINITDINFNINTYKFSAFAFIFFFISLSLFILINRYFYNNHKEKVMKKDLLISDKNAEQNNNDKKYLLDKNELIELK